jgi:hypothetical protein
VKANIPEGLTGEHQREIKGILQPLLNKLQDHGAGQIVVCLNETKEEGPAPRFVGYLLSEEMDRVRQHRGEPDPGVARFGHTPTSFMYEECLRQGGKILELDWTKDEDLRKMKPTEQAQSLKRGIKYLMLRAIEVDGRLAGVLGIGFKGKPDDKGKSYTEATLKDEAQPPSELVQCLERNFQLGGPSPTSGTNAVETLQQAVASLTHAVKLFGDAFRSPSKR